jgi:hypothetical protein
MGSFGWVRQVEGQALHQPLSLPRDEQSFDVTTPTMRFALTLPARGKSASHPAPDPLPSPSAPGPTDWRDGKGTPYFRSLSYGFCPVLSDMRIGVPGSSKASRKPLTR